MSEPDQEPAPVSQSIPSAKDPLVPVPPPQPSGPFRNPSYPQRVHVHERAHWLSVLARCQENVASFAAKLQAIAPTAAQRPQLERAHAQMLGARDQVADAVRRLPGEAGALYHEDIERLEQAVAALDRLVAKWDAT